MICSFGYTAIYAALGATWCSLITLSSSLLIAVALVLLKRDWRPLVCGNLVTLGGWITMTGDAVFNGGPTAPSLLWYTMLPVAAVLTAGAGSALAWTLGCVVCFAGFTAAEMWGVVLPQELDEASLVLFRGAALIGLIVCQFVMAYVRVVIEGRALAASIK